MRSIKIKNQDWELALNDAPKKYVNPTPVWVYIFRSDDMMCTIEEHKIFKGQEKKFLASLYDCGIIRKKMKDATLLIQFNCFNPKIGLWQPYMKNIWMGYATYPYK